MKGSYCIILARGDLSSWPLADIIDEVRRLADSGHREIVLAGIHPGHWGLEWPGEKLSLADPVGGDPRAGRALPLATFEPRSRRSQPPGCLS